MVSYDEFNAFKSENAAQHAETRDQLERLTTEFAGLKGEFTELKTQVAVLAERVDAQTTAFQRTQDLTNRLLVTLIGTMGAAFVAAVITALTR